MACSLAAQRGRHHKAAPIGVQAARERPIAPAPAARKMVESMIKVFEIRIFAGSVKSHFQAPFFPIAGNVQNTLFQLPNSSGKSRHGAPVWSHNRRTDDCRRRAAPCRLSCIAQSQPAEGTQEIRAQRTRICTMRLSRSSWPISVAAVYEVPVRFNLSFHRDPPGKAWRARSRH
jgi:hypothetical protein